MATVPRIIAAYRDSEGRIECLLSECNTKLTYGSSGMYSNVNMSGDIVIASCFPNDRGKVQTEIWKVDGNRLTFKNVSWS